MDSKKREQTKKKDRKGKNAINQEGNHLFT